MRDLIAKWMCKGSCTTRQCSCVKSGVRCIGCQCHCRKCNKKVTKVQLSVMDDHLGERGRSGYDSDGLEVPSDDHSQFDVKEQCNNFQYLPTPSVSKHDVAEILNIIDQ